MEAGMSLLGSMASVLYTTVLARPEVPIHSPLGDLNLESTRESMSSGSLARKPDSDRLPSEPGDCMKTTSATVLSPSSAIRDAMSVLLPYFTRTWIPRSSANCSSRGLTRVCERPE